MGGIYAGCGPLHPGGAALFPPQGVLLTRGPGMYKIPPLLVTSQLNSKCPCSGMPKMIRLSSPLSHIDRETRTWLIREDGIIRHLREGLL
ncbi:hypothetical protein SKAU_G00210110 [Synaphobranchus kaupii]|uniref:Uncharacterized protein n=1 Tax=Synaphobranchus kaupii TaxID=118154 RepID=A0A9Q1F8R3_SYNKA|nr:hypothetical protein SKAU_G00210110 [Synaphobranchus kaupii]